MSTKKMPAKKASMQQMSAKKTPPAQADAGAASANISERIAFLGDWRGTMLAKVRALIHAADPQITEAWKWRGVPVWEHDGIVCTGETYQDVVKLTFARGAALADPKRLFNASLDGGTRRAIDIRDGEKIDESALKQLIQVAVAANSAAVAERGMKIVKKTAAVKKAKPSQQVP